MFIDKHGMMCYNKGTEQRKDINTMKNFIITAILISLILGLGLVGCLASTDALKPVEEQTKVEETVYALTTKVILVDYTTDIVWCKDFNGNVWELQDCSDWAIDDIATLLMSDKGTRSIYDDEIIRARYQGTFEGWR